MAALTAVDALRLGTSAVDKLYAGSDLVWQLGGGEEPPAATLTYAQLSARDRPALYLRLGESSGTTAADSSGYGRNGTYAGSVLPTRGVTGLLTGDADLAADFSSGRVEVADAAWMDSTAFSVSAWITPDSVSSYRAIVTRDSSGASGRGWNLYVLNGYLHFYFYNGADRTATGTTLLAVGTTYHVAMVSDGTTVSLFVNGVREAQYTFTLTNTLANPILVGQSYAGTGVAFPFDGRIDEVEYFTYALTPAQVAERRRVGLQTQTAYDSSVLSGAPIIYLPMDESTGLVSRDRSGGPASVSATMYGGSFVADADGLQAWQQNGSSGQYGATTHATAYNAACTMEAWVKPTLSQPGTESTIWSKSLFFANSTSDFPIKLLAKSASAAKRFHLMVDAGGNFSADANIIAPTDWVEDTWYHVVGVFQNGTSRLYVNGVQVASAATGFNLSNGSGNWLVGASTDYAGGAGLSRFSGRMRRMALYPRALTAAEVADHYQTGVAGAALTYSQVALLDTPHAAYSLHESSGNWLDVSGNSRHLAAVAGVTRGKPAIAARHAGAVSGTGAAGIGIGTGFSGITKIGTLEAWIKTGATAAKGAFIKIGGTGDGWDIGIGNGRNDQLGWTFNLAHNGVNWFNTGYTFEPNTMYHCAITNDGTNIRYYINGRLIGSKVSGGYDPSQQIYLGNEENAQFLSSTVDLAWAAYYTYALPAERLLRHYRSGVAA
jgi:hypothetical protein